MKLAFFLASICCAFFLVGCADTSLQTDEDYAASKKPAPFSPDYSSQSVYNR
jgi:hypothetical protein